MSFFNLESNALKICKLSMRNSLFKQQLSFHPQAYYAQAMLLQYNDGNNGLKAFAEETNWLCYEDAIDQDPYFHRQNELDYPPRAG